MVHSKTNAKSDQRRKRAKQKPLDNVRTRVGSCKGKVTDVYIRFTAYPKWRFERYDHKVVKWGGFKLIGKYENIKSIGGVVRVAQEYIKKKLARTGLEEEI
ncbi:hypothetical protein Forpi1262_v014258 [Fusarium oxysporum f. sp. raphani]|uniref:Uncharacterized protein n=1 Tax=Fusarium oxysporum f. sp. raphani TaxID=96318 RepID=A0A8J5UJR6_FUSOX|nr:hypothetical protein Forpi1262_v014258 [Fusarium oxysporum f. sp. raphani]KAJ0134826.1 Uncharacterized protein HZ326_22131 [Fusarium oxysporum f. sp. albedinis]KAJ0138475.1 hypothetical protein HZ326_18593 [Fusarium oxysporum f. sp. albedinis]